jgi:hypothetical protein
VVADDVAHIKNHGIGLNRIIAIYRKVLFFDPFVSFQERAIHFEKRVLGGRVLGRKTKETLSPSCVSCLLTSSIFRTKKRSPYCSLHVRRCEYFETALLCAMGRLSGAPSSFTPGLERGWERAKRDSNWLRTR